MIPDPGNHVPVSFAPEYVQRWGEPAQPSGTQSSMDDANNVTSEIAFLLLRLRRQSRDIPKSRRQAVELKTCVAVSAIRSTCDRPTPK